MKTRSADASAPLGGLHGEDLESSKRLEAVLAGSTGDSSLR